MALYPQARPSSRERQVLRLELTVAFHSPKKRQGDSNDFQFY